MANSVDPGLFWVHAVGFYTLFVSNARQLFAADDFSGRHFQMHFFLCALRVKLKEKWGGPNNLFGLSLQVTAHGLLFVH